MIKQYTIGEFGVVISDNPEMTSVVFEPEIDSVINNNVHDRMLFKNAFNSLLSQYADIQELAKNLGPKLNKEIMTDMDWFMDYLDDGYTSDYKFSLFEEGWTIKNVK